MLYRSRNKIDGYELSCCVPSISVSASIEQKNEEITDLGQILCEVKYKFCLFVVGSTCPYQVHLLSCEKQGSSDFQHRRKNES